jgi:hypothetical protein
LPANVTAADSAWASVAALAPTMIRRSMRNLLAAARGARHVHGAVFAPELKYDASRVVDLGFAADAPSGMLAKCRCPSMICCCSLADRS